ncbi:sialoadhesin-like isoform X2 [Sphaeramia orbicularis]|uniref:sialoadhesin-like isoform X2 n=1 Tax=Sphaeramia orbicularis TaxID=375764 RepID=UPI0011802BDD|nr:sialoadhesin-like isoform X2 [Sphaeramia orbicularis]
MLIICHTLDLPAAVFKQRAAMDLRAATNGVLILLFVSVVETRNDTVLNCISAQICAVKGSTVDIRCVFKQPRKRKKSPVTVNDIFWFREIQNEEPEDLRTESEYSGRVKYYCDKKSCTVRLTDLRHSDSAKYKLKFRNRQRESTAVTLSVTDPDLQIQVRRSFVPWAELFCHSSCHLPDRLSYIWYKNGQEIQDRTFSFYSDYFSPADSYSCAAKGYKDFPSPPVCVQNQTCNRVTYTSRSICAPRGSSVDMSCTYRSYEDHVESSLWFSLDHSYQWGSASQPEDLSEDSQCAGRVQIFETQRGRSTLRITDLRESDSAQYHFKFKTYSFEWRSSLPGTTLTVTALQVLVVSTVTVTPSVTEAELRCFSSCTPHSYTWFKNGEQLLEESSCLIGTFYSGDTISCAFKDAPKVPLVSVSPSHEIIEGSSVTLTCSSDANPVAYYTWYRKGNSKPHPVIEGPELFFSSIQSSESAEYYCRAENRLGATTSGYVFINVEYAPRLPSVSMSPSAQIMEGSSVTLSCSSDANPPVTKYTWYKEDEYSPSASGQNFTISDVRSEHSGNYYCEAQSSRGRQTSTFHLTVGPAEQADYTTSDSNWVTREDYEKSTVNLAMEAGTQRSRWITSTLIFLCLLLIGSRLLILKYEPEIRHQRLIILAQNIISSFLSYLISLLPT